MWQDNLIKHRLTVQNFILPITKSESCKSFSLHKKQKPFLQSNYQSQKKIICAPQPIINHNFRQRHSEELQPADPILDKFSSLPEIIRGKSKTVSTTPKFTEERLHSFSSRKLNVNAYRKIEKSISKKYNRKMESLASLELLPGKMFTINNLKGELPPQKQIERERVERIQQRFVMEKHHIDRLKDQYSIPLELQTQRYHQQEYDSHQLNLQLKNIIRFEFKTQIGFPKPKKAEQHDQTKIEGWEIQHQNIKTTAQLYS